MKRWLKFMGAGALALSLAACGETAEPVDNSGDKDSAGNSDLTLEELFAKTTEASGEAKSFHTDMVTNQSMTMGEGMDMEMAMDLSMDMTVDPLAFYQTGETSFVSEEMEGMPAMKTEMYFTEEGMYTYEPTMDMWMKLPGQDMEELKTLMDQQSGDVSQQLEDLEAFKDDFSFEQSGDEYILKLNAAGEEYQELINDQMGQMLGEMEMEAQDALEGMTINKVYYEIFIDKETFLPNTMNIDMDFDMEVEGETMNIKTDLQSEYSKYNEIEAITVPAEVIEQAQEI